MTTAISWDDVDDGDRDVGPIAITGRDYTLTHPEAAVTTSLLRVWRCRGLVRAVGRNDRGEVLYDLASINKAERDTLMSRVGCGRRRARVL